MFRSRKMSIGLAAIICSTSHTAIAQTSPPAEPAQADAPEAVGSGDIIVTAQKRSESAQRVAMSIQAESGDTLSKLRVVDTASLQKVVPGFQATPNAYGTTVFSIRGVGFQDTALASSPTVSVYLDQAPLPYASLSLGATLDLERVEILKGPQGTLFGSNATGGAVNYVTNKPTSTFEAGIDASYSRFQNIDASGFVSGPLSSTVRGRAAVRVNNSGAWQKGYGPQDGQKIGGTDFVNARLTLDADVTERLFASVTLNGWRDKSYNQAGQLIDVIPLVPSNTQSAAILNYPRAPSNNRAAGWNQCVNTDPLNPFPGQELGTTFPVPGGNTVSQGFGSVAQAGAQPLHCRNLTRDNSYYSATANLKYELTDDVTLTSLSEYQKFKRSAGVDGSGMPYQVYQSDQRGKIESFFQELRLSGQFGGRGNWMIGGNYEWDKTEDSYLQSYFAASVVPTALPLSALCPAFAAGGYTCTPSELALPAVQVYGLGTTRPFSNQTKNIYAVFGNVEYPILDQLTLQAGVRYTKQNMSRVGCGSDSGEGSWSAVAKGISNLLGVLNGTISPSTYLAGGGNGIDTGPGSCPTTGPGPDFLSFGVAPTSKLNEDNVSWKLGAKWDLSDVTMLYANVSRGYKGGSYPTIPTTTFTQLRPVVQEKLTAFEVGFKSRLLDRQLLLNAAGFYYDYRNKQILGANLDPVFGPLTTLVNVPKSRIIGFEVSANYTPDFLPGFRIAPAISYQNGKAKGCSTTAAEGCIDGNYFNYDQFGNFVRITGQRLPAAPRTQARVDTEYEFGIHDALKAFVGGSVNYTSSTTSFFVNPNPPPSGYNNLDIRSYALVDLRAGVEGDRWRVQVWGQNVLDKYYWLSTQKSLDSVLRFTGMPATYGVTVSLKYR